MRTRPWFPDSDLMEMGLGAEKEAFRVLLNGVSESFYPTAHGPADFSTQNVCYEASRILPGSAAAGLLTTTSRTMWKSNW